MQIIVNGTPAEHDGETISYDDIATIVAFEERWQPPLPLLSVTYRWRGEGDAVREGIISPASSPIKAAPGMTFSAYQTSAA